jgi:hypothetical protein
MKVNVARTSKVAVPRRLLSLNARMFAPLLLAPLLFAATAASVQNVWAEEETRTRIPRNGKVIPAATSLLTTYGK